MSEAKHTPGPWSFYTEPQPNGCPIVGAKGLMIAMLAHSINYNDQAPIAIANARLISAAPELLEACKRMIGSLGVMIGDPDNDGDIVFARAAIAKATGETK